MDKAKKRQLKKYLSWICIAAVVALLTAMPLLARADIEEDGPQASILEATVQCSNVDVTLRGGGTLAAGSRETVNLPAGVKITEFLVKNGDTVAEGDPVAAVDKVSLMNAIVQVEDSLDSLRKDIRAAADDTLDSTIRATAGGYVKKIYAQAGDSVRDVMLAHGALAVLSLDGRMAVTIERDYALAAGDTVLVQRSDGSEISGRVESSLDGKIIVSMEDKGYPIGEAVTVFTETGDQLGSGALYVHNAWTATGYSGTVRTVQAAEGRTLSAGSTLFSLTDTEFTGTRDSLAALHREYEQLLQDMFQMYETGVITAPCSGTVFGIDSHSTHLLAAGEAGWTVLLLSGELQCTGTDPNGESCRAEEHIKGCYYYCTGAADCTAKPQDHRITCLSLCIASDGSSRCPAISHKPGCIESCISATEAGKCPATGTHKESCIESCISANGSCPTTGTHKANCLGRCDKSETCSATVHHHSTCLTFCTGDEACTAENHKESCYMASLTYYATAARVDQAGTSELIVYEDTATVYLAKPGADGWVLLEPGQLNTQLMITQTTRAVSDPSKYKAGDIVLFWTGYQGESAVKSGDARYQAAADTPSAPGTGGMGGLGNLGGLSGFSGFSGMSGSFGSMSGGSQSTQPQLYDLTGSELMAITAQDTMTLTVTIDEQDIARIQLGQDATVEITALKGRIFDAWVSDIGMTGTNNGGSSKFTVELTLNWDKDMLAGMNATARLPLYTKAEVLTLPVAALAETKSGTVVYTALDPETGEPASPVEVTTGVSDGQTVEIVSGLESGTTVYYSYYDTLELDHTAKTEYSFR